MESARIAKWDNIKFWMILCVVIGHVLYQFKGVSPEADALYLFIYSFHMPVFIFVAGLFSKRAVKEKRYELIIEYLAVYLIMKLLKAVGDYIVSGSYTFHFLWESGPAWFALAVAVFLFVTMLIQPYEPKYILAVSLLAGCLAGLDTHFGDHFASMRILVFYPVFLCGYYLEPEKLAEMGKPIHRLISLVLLAGGAAAAFLFVGKSAVVLKLFK